MARGNTRRLGDLVVSPEAVGGLFERLGAAWVELSAEVNRTATASVPADARAAYTAPLRGRDVTDFQARLRALGDGGWYAPSVARELQVKWLPAYERVQRGYGYGPDAADIRTDLAALLGWPTAGVDVSAGLGSVPKSVWLVGGGLAAWWLLAKRRRR